MAETKWLKHFLVLVLYWQKSVSADDCLATTNSAHSSVHCTFNDNISSSKTSFVVELYYPFISSSVETLLACWWEKDKLDCNPGPGIEYNKNVMDKLTIRGPPMMDKVGGKVKCQGSKSSPEQVESCILTSVETMETAQGDGNKHDALAVLSFVGVLLILITILIVICLLYKYKLRVFKYIRRWEATKRGSVETGESGRPLISHHPSMGGNTAGSWAGTASQDTSPAAESISVTVEDISLLHPQAVTSPDAQTNISKGGNSAGSRAGTDLQIMITGPQGSGKSSLGNTITGRDTFPVGHSTDNVATTGKPTEAVVTRCGKRIKVVDTPYICDPNRYSEEDQRQQISQWKKMTSPGPSAILLALSGRRMFASQHYDDYQKLRTLWGDEDFCRRLIVIFTFADKHPALYPSKSLEQQLETAVPNLKRVLHDAGNCYMEVNNRASQEENGAVVKEILDGVERKAESISVAVEDTSLHHPQAVTSPDAQTNISKKEPLLQSRPPDPSTQQQPTTQNVGAASSVTKIIIAQPSPQPQSQPGDPGTTVTDTSPSGQNTDTAQPPQQHSQEAEAAGLLAASPESPEEVPLVAASEDWSGDRSRKEEDKSKKNGRKNSKKEKKEKKFTLNIGKKN